MEQIEILTEDWFAQLETELRQQLEVATREDPVCAVWVSPENLQAVAEWWNQTEYAQAGLLLETVDLEPEQKYLIVRYSTRMKGYLLHQYQEFLEFMQGHPVQPTIDDLRRMDVQEKIFEFAQRKQLHNSRIVVPQKTAR